MKERILDIAIQQMKSGGYKNLNFANIAAELDTTRANLHHHFKNKEGLGIAATESYIQEQKEIMDDIIHTNDGDIATILKEIENHLIEIASESGSSSACICSQLIHESGVPENLKQLALSRFQAEQKDIETQIEKYKSNAPSAISNDVKTLTFKVMTTMYGIGQMALIESDKKSLVKNIRGSLVSILG